MSKIERVFLQVWAKVALNDYMEVDEDVITSMFMSDEDIIFHGTSSEIILDSDNEEDDEEPHKMVSVQDAQKSVLLLRHYFEQHNETDFDLIIKLETTKVLYKAKY